MEGLKVLRNTQIIILGLSISAGTVASTVILSKGILQAKRFTNEIISVTGSAEKQIQSDSIVWRSSFIRRDITLPATFSALNQDLAKVRDYLASKGILSNEVIVPQAETRVLYRKNVKGNDTNEIEAYEMTQTVQVRSREVSKVSEVSRQSTELLHDGIQFISEAPQFFYTRLAELKIEMLEEATKNAKRRAEGMAGSTGNQIGLMRSAKMGVFQITPVNSYEVSWYGENDTSSLDKKVTAIVEVGFAIAS